MAVLTGRFPSTTILSPGQRFLSNDLQVSELTVARLVTDRFGLLHVTLRAADGREISAFAEQVEAAISDGQLMPVALSAQRVMSAC